MKPNRGFTLIEILVVIVVIAMLVSITALNTDSDPRADALKLNSQAFLYYLEEATDEAILNNKSIAIYFTKYSATPYSWQQVKQDPTDSNADIQQQNEQKETWDWAAYESRVLMPVEFDPESEIRMFINGSEVPLNFQKNDDQTVTPQLIIQASGIQSIIEFEIGLADYEKTISITGNGAGRFKVSPIMTPGEA
jgi:prepilin-type N-terminal cleavage/methylation domain-containing protein